MHSKAGVTETASARRRLPPEAARLSEAEAFMLDELRARRARETGNRAFVSNRSLIVREALREKLEREGFALPEESDA